MKRLNPQNPKVAALIVALIVVVLMTTSYVASSDAQGKGPFRAIINGIAKLEAKVDKDVNPGIDEALHEIADLKDLVKKLHEKVDVLEAKLDK